MFINSQNQKKTNKLLLGLYENENSKVKRLITILVHSNKVHQDLILYLSLEVKTIVKLSETGEILDVVARTPVVGTARSFLSKIATSGKEKKQKICFKKKQVLKVDWKNLEKNANFQLKVKKNR